MTPTSAIINGCWWFNVSFCYNHECWHSNTSSNTNTNMSTTSGVVRTKLSFARRSNTTKNQQRLTTGKIYSVLTPEIFQIVQNQFQLDKKWEKVFAGNLATQWWREPKIKSRGLVSSSTAIVATIITDIITTIIIAIIASIIATIMVAIFRNRAGVHFVRYGSPPLWLA